MGVIVNGKITGTMLGTEDHGIMTFMLSVDMADNMRKSMAVYLKNIGSTIKTRFLKNQLIQIAQRIWNTKQGVFYGKYILVMAVMMYGGEM